MKNQSITKNQLGNFNFEAKLKTKIFFGDCESFFGFVLKRKKRFQFVRAELFLLKQLRV